MDKKLCHKVKLSTLVGVSALVLVMVVEGLAFRWEPVDDAYISFRYAENFASGYGLVFNPGEQVEGYTNFLWTVILAGAAWFELDVPHTAKWLGVFFASLGLVLTWRLCLRVAEERNWPRAMAWSSPAILVCFPGWSYWAFSGMEGSLLSCLVLAFLLLGCRRKASFGTLVAGGVFGFLAAMTRWEVVLLWPVAVIAQLLDTSRAMARRLPRAALLSLVLVIGFGVYFVWRLVYYGELMPNTYYAKMGADIFARAGTGIVYTGEFAVEWLLAITFVVWFFGPYRHWSIILAAVLLIQSGYVTWTGGDFFAWLRFYLPVLPIAAIMTTNLIECLTASVCGARAKNFVRVVLTLTVALSVTGAGFRIDYRSAFDQLVWVRGWKKVGLWARTTFPERYRIAIAPVGAVGYYSRHHIIDMLGMTDFEVAHFGEVDPSEGPGHQKSFISSIIRRRPEIILGQAVIFDHFPTAEETISSSIRKALKKMYRMPEFQRLYRYEVAQTGQTYIPYWIDRNLEHTQYNGTAAVPYDKRDD